MCLPKQFSASCLMLLATLAGCSQLEPTSPDSASAETQPDIYTDYLNRDVRDDIFYFVLPDRFANGNPANDSGSVDMPISYGGFKPGHKAYYHGGDLQGLAQKLDYLQGLGVTAIWMTPILRNRAVQGGSSGYHGYWIVDFTQIDPHLGTNQDLKSLIDKAHQKGIKVFFDIITNHTADIIRYRECHDEQGRHLNQAVFSCDYKSKQQISQGDTYTPFIPEGQQSIKIPGWLNDPEYYNNQGDSFWEGESAVYGDFAGLDDLNTRRADVVAGFTEIYKNIITEFKPDGFRIDTVKHVDMSFWQQFTPEIMAHAKREGIPNFHIFGEVYDTNPAFLSRFTTQGKLPAVLDFAFQHRVNQVFAQGQASHQLSELFADDDYYTDADSASDSLLTFTGNHDMGRFGLFLNQSLTTASNQEKTQRSILAHAFMYFARGIPVIYYGDEQGFTGDGHDQAAREDMMPSKVASYNDNDLLGTEQTTADDNFNPNHIIYRALSQYSEIYKQHPALRRGIHLNRFASSGVYAFSRIHPDEKTEYLLIFNTRKNRKTIELTASAAAYKNVLVSDNARISDLKANNKQLSLTIPALSFVIYKAQSQLEPAALKDITIASIKADLQDSERLNIEYQLGEEAEQSELNLYKVTTEYLSEQGQYVLAATDWTPPYRAKLQMTDWQSGAQKIRVTLDNLAGTTQTRIFELSQY